MHDYRVYCVDKNGKITTASWIEADSVEHAVEIVRDTHKGVDCEIWDGTKCLAKVPTISLSVSQPAYASPASVGAP